MTLLDDNGRIFGILNIIDAVIILFIIILVSSLFLSSKYPPKLKEHRDVVFQMYFEGEGTWTDNPVPDAIAQQVFVPGMPLVATYSKDDRAVISDAKRIALPSYNSRGFLVTINGSLEVDSEGDILFNNNDVAPGNLQTVQIGSSYLTGKIWRVDYEHASATIHVTVILYENINGTYNVTYNFPEAVVYDYVGNEIGKIIENKEENNPYFLTLSLHADIYDGEYYVSEILLKNYGDLYFVVNGIIYRGKIIGVSL